MIQLASKRKKLTTLQKEYPDAIFADVTSKATDDLRKLSPFFPHYDIPVPFTEGMTATCVEAIWQGLKVFEGADVDIEMFRNDTMKNIKRTVRRFGMLLRHRKGVERERCDRIAAVVRSRHAATHSPSVLFPARKNSLAYAYATRPHL